jgi:chromosome segregation ATPase
MNSGYYQKYLKYKAKYLNLVNKMGGSDVASIVNDETEQQKMKLIGTIDNQIEKLTSEIEALDASISEENKELGIAKAKTKADHDALVQQAKQAKESIRQAHEIEIASINTHIEEHSRALASEKRNLLAEKERLANDLKEEETRDSAKLKQTDSINRGKEKEQMLDIKHKKAEIASLKKQISLSNSHLGKIVKHIRYRNKSPNV